MLVASQQPRQRRASSALAAEQLALLGRPVMARRASTTLAAEQLQFLARGPERNQSEAAPPAPTKAPAAQATPMPSPQAGEGDAKTAVWRRALATSDAQFREIADKLPRGEVISLLFNVEGVVETEAEAAKAAVISSPALASTCARLAKALCTRAAALGKLCRFADSAQAATAALRTATAAQQTALISLARHNRMVAASALGDTAGVIADADALLADGGDGGDDCGGATREATHVMRATALARRGEFGRALFDCARAGARGAKLAAAIRARGGGENSVPATTVTTPTGAMGAAAADWCVVGSRKRSCDSEDAGKAKRTAGWAARLTKTMR